MYKYCKYHHNNGHMMDECKALQDKIEELIRSRHLKRFVRRKGESCSRTGYRRYNDRYEHRKKNRDKMKEEGRSLPQGTTTPLVIGYR